MKKPSNQPSDHPPTKKPSPKWLPIIVVGGAILLLAGAGTYAFVTNGLNRLANTGKTGSATPSPASPAAASPTPEPSPSPSPSPSPVAVNCTPDQEMYVTAQSGVNLRTGASASSPVLATVRWNAGVLAGCFEGDWAKVTYNNLTGYISRQYLTTTMPGIVLSGGLKVADVRLQWTVSGIDTTYGFRILRSSSADILYPSNIDHTSTVDGNARSFLRYYLLGGGTSYFRVCQITKDGGCGVYSNAIPIVEQIASTVKSITITGSTGTTINWTFSDQAPNGFVLLWLPTPSPAWGGGGVVASLTQIPNPIATSATIGHSLMSGQTFHVRVCENIGGRCGTYSNEITVVAP